MAGFFLIGPVVGFVEWRLALPNYLVFPAKFLASKPTTTTSTHSNASSNSVQSPTPIYAIHDLITVCQDVRNTQEAEHGCAVRHFPSRSTKAHQTDYLPSTPQNTPLNAAPISSHATQPQVGTIKEGMRPISSSFAARFCSPHHLTDLQLIFFRGPRPRCCCISLCSKSQTGLFDSRQTRFSRRSFIWIR